MVAILSKIRNQPILYFFAFLGGIFILVLFTSLYVPPKQEIKEIPVKVYVDKTEYKNLNVFIKRRDINNLIIFYQQKHLNEYEKILNFYDTYTHNRDITNAIIKYSIEYDQPVNYCFGLAQRESEFNPRAYNKNSSTSIDRGLFQLNNKDRPKWKPSDFYNVDKNAKEAISCLQWLSSVIEDEDMSLAAYNAGYNRIKSETTIPFTTVKHVFAARENEIQFDIDFNTKLIPSLKYLKIEPRP